MNTNNLTPADAKRTIQGISSSDNEVFYTTEGLKGHRSINIKDYKKGQQGDFIAAVFAMKDEQWNNQKDPLVNWLIQCYEEYWNKHQDTKKEQPGYYHYYEESENNNNNKKQSKTKTEETESEDKKEYCVQKYTLDGQLHESVIVSGKAFYLKVDGENIPELVGKIEVSDTVFIPPSQNGQINKPYIFESEEEISQYLERAQEETLDTLYTKVKNIFQKYVDREPFQINLYAADLIFTYFQDRLGMTHYLHPYGDNESGKSADALVFNELGYRPIMASSLTAANVFQYLGEVQEGQGTIIEDEADKIDTDTERMRIYKVGYTTGTKIPRMDISQGRIQRAYWTYGFKFFAAEKQQHITYAKAFNDRTFYLHCVTGHPKFYIKEVLAATGDPEYEALKAELVDLRKLLLVFRMIHHKDAFKNVKTNISNRARELTISLIRLFQASKALEDILPTLEKLLTEKQEKKSETLDARIYRIIAGKINSTTYISSKELWEEFKASTEGEQEQFKPSSYNTAEFGLVTQKMIASVVQDRFGAKPEHGKQGNGFVFTASEIERVGHNYDNSKPVKIEIIRDSPAGELGLQWTSMLSEPVGTFTPGFSVSN